MSLLKREVDALEGELNGWSRVSPQTSLLPVLASSGQRSAAAVLACVWPLASLVMEFIVIPPVPNPPAAVAAKAPDVAAAALAVLTAAMYNDKESPFRWGEESLTCPSPLQGLLEWLDNSLQLSMDDSTPPPSPSSPHLLPPPSAFLQSGPAHVPPTSPASTPGWRAWALLCAAVDLVGPTGDTLLWDAKYRHSLSIGAAIGGDGGMVPVPGAVDPACAQALDWGRRRETDTNGRDDTRASRGQGTPGGPRRSSGGFRASRGGGEGEARAPYFVDVKSKVNPLADAGGVPWMLVRLLLAVFVSGGTAVSSNSTAAGRSRVAGTARRGSFISSNGGNPNGSGSSKGNRPGGSGPPSIALFALDRLIALLNSLEASGYQYYEFEVLHVAARVSTALRVTRLTPQSEWVLGAFQLLVRNAFRSRWKLYICLPDPLV